MALDIKIPRSHPGGVIKDWILPEGMSITKAAQMLGVSRQSLDALVNERRSVTPEMALRLETVFGGTARLFLALQASYDLQESQKKSYTKIQKLAPHVNHPSLRKTEAA
ncbi:MAG: addiction module antidote protein, HigA family [Robiginitomaculum sp.]|nr:MAG: addiction module antidote protein, HigA family [Robiginitomaculum sp.]